MARLIAFLGTGLFTGFLASVFQIPNMLPLLLIIFWVGMGAGLRIWWGVVGALLMPLVIVLPMWLLPGPNELGVLYPPNDSRLLEYFKVSGAGEYLAQAEERYETRLDEWRRKYEIGLETLDNRPRQPRWYEANIRAAGDYVSGEAEGAYRVWPMPRAFTIGLVITVLAWTVNTMTTRPFRDPRPHDPE